MTDRPIIFSAPMIRALLAGRKTQTRLVLTPQPDDLIEGQIPDQLRIQPCARLQVAEDWQIARETLDYETGGEYDVFEWLEEDYGDPCPFLNGDARGGMKAGIFYAADGEDENPSVFYDLIGVRGDVLREAEIAWRPGEEMPRWASRLTLTVTDVRVERLQDISEADAQAEGVRLMRDGGGVFVGREGPGRLVTPWPTAREAFMDIWESIHGRAAWAANPWVAAISFEVHRENIDALPPAAMVPPTTRAALSERGGQA